MAWFRKVFVHVQNHVPQYAGIGAAAMLAFSLVPQTLGLSKYQKVVGRFKDDGTQHPVDQSNLLLIDKVRNNLNNDIVFTQESMMEDIG